MIHEINIGRVIKKAVDLCGIYKRVTSHTFMLHIYFKMEQIYEVFKNYLVINQLKQR